VGPSFVWRISLTVIGGAVGLLASYLFRPFLAQSATLESWFTHGFGSPYATTIVVLGVVGSIIGFVIALLIDRNSKIEITANLNDSRPFSFSSVELLRLLVAWIWIAVPLGWGVYQSVQKSLPLFQSSSVSTAKP
jgi:hypothetical protein